MSPLSDNRLTGPAMITASSLFFALTSLFVKMGSDEVPVGAMVAVRFIVMFAVMELLRLTGTITIRPRNKRLLLYRSVTASLGGIFYFFSVASIPIAEAIVLKFTYPLFAVTIAALVYHEHAGKRVFGSLAFSFIGIVVMMSPISLGMNPGYLWGLLNGLSAGVAVAFLRQLRATDDSSTVLYFHSLAGMLLSLPFLAGGWGSPGPSGMTFTLLAALFGMLGQLALVYGFRYIKTGRGSVVMALEVVFSALLALVFLGQIPGPWKIVGGMMVLAGVMLVSGGEKAGNEDIRKAEV